MSTPLLLPRPFKQKNPFLAPLRVNRELHKGGERSCMHIELDITGSSLKYTAGDHVALLPENSPQLVEKIADLLGVDLETIFSLVNKDGACSCTQHPLPYIDMLFFYVSCFTVSLFHLQSLRLRRTLFPVPLHTALHSCTMLTLPLHFGLMFSGR